MRLKRLRTTDICIEHRHNVGTVCPPKDVTASGEFNFFHPQSSTSFLELVQLFGLCQHITPNDQAKC